MDNNSLTILDGGMGRLLQKMGAPFQQPEWSALSLMEAPQYVEQAHQAFIDAGASIITTNTYAVIPFHIGEERFKTQGENLIKLAAKIARETANNNRNVKVAGCLPPAFGSYRADFFNIHQFEGIYTPLIEQQDDYIDFWLAETVSSIEEAEAIYQILKSKKTNKPLWLSFTLMDRENDTVPPQIRSGESLEEILNFLKAHGDIQALLFNCSQLEEMEPALKALSSHNCPITYGAYANAFPAIKKDALANKKLTTMREDAAPENYLQVAQKWVDLGATIIGGCCGIGPEHIQALRKLKNPS